MVHGFCRERFILTLAAAAILPYSGASAQITRQSSPYLRTAAPASTNAPQVMPLDAVILRAEQPDAVIKSLTVSRQLSITALKSKPVVRVGETDLNFKPMLDNPGALYNIATSLRKLPVSAEVVADDTTAYEIDEGMVVYSKLIYRLKSGTCSDSARRAAVANAGVDCANKLDDGALAAAFANKNDAHYVADPAKRAAALAEAYKQRAVMTPKIAAHVAELRNAFNDPSQRGQIEAKLGADEAARLASLSDEQLTMEVVNSGETEVEDVVFIPKNETPNAQLSQSSLVAQNGAETSTPLIQLILDPAIAGFAKKNADQSSPPAQETVRNLETRIFLTGFTLGRRYEWSKQVSTTIKWCLIGCSETYHARVFATIGLGFGLRFPMQISGLYKHRLENGQETASVTTNYEPIDGDANDYKNTGLDDAQIFGGQEIVAEAKAEAGVIFDLPIYGEKKVSWKEGDDYTAALPAPFTNGQFKPPTPGGTGFPAMEKVFEDVDLLAGFANWGIFGATISPAFKAELHSGSLHFRLHDLVKNETTVLQFSGDTIALGINPSDHSSRFTLSNPVYNLGFLVTPGLQGRLFIDLAVWSTDWKKTVWFPQVAVELPPSGVNFACHEGTSCSRSYNFSPAHQSEGVGPTSATDEKLLQWRLGFDNKWKTQCPDEECKGGIWIIGAATMLYEKKLLDETAAIEWKVHSLELPKEAKMEHYAKIYQGYQDAENQAAEALEKAKIRKSKLGNTYPIILTYIPLPKTASEPPPPVIIQGRPRIPILRLPPAATQPAPAVMKSTLCSFTSGPRAGQIQDYAPMAAIPVGSNCQDAAGSFGKVVVQ